MPLYEYLCDSCGRTSEILQRLSEPPITVCPHCGGGVRKMPSAPAFQFKGSGWYVTDYAKKSGSEAGGAGGAAKAGSSAAGESGSSAGGATDGATSSSASAESATSSAAPSAPTSPPPPASKS